jgi:hypothetical protein
MNVMPDDVTYDKYQTGALLPRKVLMLCTHA